MKKQKLLFIPLILSFGIGLLSCNFGSNNGNSQTYQAVAAVVVETTGGTVLGTPLGYLAAPSLLDVSAGDCLYLYQLVIDYDNQSSDKYVTASEIVKETVNQGRFVTGDPNELDDYYTLPLSNINGFVTNEYLEGRIFVVMTCKDRNPSFRLLYNNPTEDIDSNGVTNFYLQAAPSSSSADTDIQGIQAFNLMDYIQQYGRDTLKTFNDSSDKYPFKYVKANFKYVSKIEDGVPTYTTLNSSGPIEFYIFNNN